MLLNERITASYQEGKEKMYFKFLPHIHYTTPTHTYSFPLVYSRLDFARTFLGLCRTLR